MTDEGPLPDGQGRPLHAFAGRPTRASPQGVVRRSKASPKRPFAHKHGGAGGGAGGHVHAPTATTSAAAAHAPSASAPSTAAAHTSTDFWTPGSHTSTAATQHDGGVGAVGDATPSTGTVGVVGVG